MLPFEKNEIPEGPILQERGESRRVFFILGGVIGGVFLVGGIAYYLSPWSPGNIKKGVPQSEFTPAPSVTAIR